MVREDELAQIAAVYLEPDEENVLLLEIFKEEVARVRGQLRHFAQLMSVFPKGQVSPLEELPAAQRLVRYLLLTNSADLSFLREPRYIEMWRQGIMPGLQSPYWLNYMSIPDAFVMRQRDFLDLLRDQLGMNIRREQDDEGPGE